MIASDPHLRARTLVEALPYIRRFHDEIIVIKYGGNVLSDAGSSLTELAEDVALMRSVGMRPVIVHGGGPQIDDLADRLGLVPSFVDGLRVTDAAMLEVVRMALLGTVNPAIVTALGCQGAAAVGLSGADSSLAMASRISTDLGFVGSINRVQTGVVAELVQAGVIPVVASLGVETGGQLLNVNADSFASALAVALGAAKLIFLTNISGLLAEIDDPDSLIAQAAVDQVQGLIDNGKIRGGMIPKVTAALDASMGGVERVHLIDGTVPHSLLLELLTDEGVGTMIVGGSR
ncbi:acetylglutamate kinase [Ferrimicrobium acidiphilum]|uniref:acetylglutamate kinase n=1 Tax=Ferrimicrobium acidiphilum TaxID=121039 RepID=UPI0023F5134D|nr:acetylglutamate kinase [Ferrimicrobium acidiphilum]